MAFDSDRTKLGQMESKLFKKHKCQRSFSIECTEPRPVINGACLERANKKECVELILNVENCCLHQNRLPRTCFTNEKDFIRSGSC